MAENIWKWMEMDGNGYKWLEWQEFVIKMSREVARKNIFVFLMIL